VDVAPVDAVDEAEDHALGFHTHGAKALNSSNARVSLATIRDATVGYAYGPPFLDRSCVAESRVF
jgi:hypothetical protein